MGEALFCLTNKYCKYVWLLWTPWILKTLTVMHVDMISCFKHLLCWKLFRNYGLNPGYCPLLLLDTFFSFMNKIKKQFSAARRILTSFLGSSVSFIGFLFNIEEGLSRCSFTRSNWFCAPHIQPTGTLVRSQTCWVYPPKHPRLQSKLCSFSLPLCGSYEMPCGCERAPMWAAFLSAAVRRALTRLAGTEHSGDACIMRNNLPYASLLCRFTVCPH